MKGIGRAAAGLLAAALLGGCDTPIFQDVGSDPHPPAVVLLGLALQPLKDEQGNAPEPAFGPPTRITVRPNDKAANKIALRVSYADSGADIVNFKVRDLDGVLNQPLTPSAPRADLDGDGILEDLEVPEFFIGTVGLANLENVNFSTTTMAGDHRIELWAEDSHDSRSEKTTFIVTIQH